MEIKSGNSESFRQIFNQVYEDLIKVTYHIVLDKDVAEELCQEAFIKFFEKDATFPSEDDAKYWLIRVVQNLAYNYVSRQKRERNMVEKVKQLPESVVYNGSGESDLIENDTKQMVRNCIASLDDKYRSVIVLKEFANLGYKQIAAILRISENNVKVRVFRARKEIEEILTKGN